MVTRGGSIRAVFGLLMAVASVTQAGPARAADTERLLVVLRPGTSATQAAAAFALATHGRVVHVFEHALRGFEVEVPEQSRVPTPSQATTIVRDVDSDVGRKYPFEEKAAFVSGLDKRQVVDTGIRRIGGDVGTTRAGDGGGTVDTDIAILDTGIDETHPDLNVVGGVDCTDSVRPRLDGYQPWHDTYGHGTSMASIAAAKDNAIGIVGVAPGARLWAVKVAASATGEAPGQNALNDPGAPIPPVRFYGDLICGLDWIAGHADRIDVTSASLGFGASRVEPCNGKLDSALPPTVYKTLLSTRATKLATIAAFNVAQPTRAGDDMIHEAFCAVVNRGIPIAVAAGNGGIDINEPGFSPVIPAAYPEVMAVSALSDFDGRPGGLAGRKPPCGLHLWPASKPIGKVLHAILGGPPATEVDDSFTFFSDYGKDVDLIAPGVCIIGAFPGNRYLLASGTSEATPLVAGAAALYRRAHPAATAAQIREALRGLGSTDWNNSDDPDHVKEPLLDVHTL